MNIPKAYLLITTSLFLSSLSTCPAELLEVQRRTVQKLQKPQLTLATIKECTTENLEAFLNQANQHALREHVRTLSLEDNILSAHKKKTDDSTRKKILIKKLAQICQELGGRDGDLVTLKKEREQLKTESDSDSSEGSDR